MGYAEKIKRRQERNPEYVRMITENREDRNRQLNKVLWFLVLTGPGIYAGVSAGVFDYLSPAACASLSAMLAALALLHYLIIRRHPAGYAGVFTGLAVPLVCESFMVCVHMHVNITFYLVPLFSIMYLESWIYYITCAATYIMMFCTNLAVAGYYTEISGSEDISAWFFDKIGGYTIEFVIMVVIGAIINNSIHHAGKSLYSARRKAQNESLKDRIHTAMQKSLSEETPDAAIVTLLRYIGQNVEADRTYVFEDNQQDNTTSNTYEWVKEGAESEIKSNQNISLDSLKWIYDQFENGENVVVSDPEMIIGLYPETADLLRPDITRKFILNPIFIKNKVCGFYGVDNPREKNIEELSSLFKLMGSFLTSLLVMRNNFRNKEMLAEIDALTGIRNRGSGELAIVSLLSEGEAGMFVLIDADKFKEINDTYGHDAGDKVLVSIAATLKSTFRRSDIILRLGGDEFAAYAVGLTDRTAAEHVIERFFKAIDNLEFSEYPGLSVNVSAGAVFHEKDSDTDFEVIYKSADEVMYEGKTVSGNTIRFRDSESL